MRSHFDAASRRVGDRIELVGKIVEVKRDTGRRGRGRGRPYVFINFGPWRGNIVKISIWSEGLAELKEQPSAAWVNRWVSVVGLMDPPYDSKKYGYRHLSVTVEKDGQIQFLDETQARFRLASIGKTATARNRDVVKGIINGTGNPKPLSSVGGTSTPPKRGGQPTTPPNAGTRNVSRNTEIVDRIKRASRTPSSGGFAPPPMSSGD